MVLLLALLVLLGSAAVQSTTTPVPKSIPGSGSVLVIPIEGVIGPATADFFHRKLDQAQRRGVRLIVLRMDTPGGLDDSMRRIIRDILGSSIPIATYVAPEGARAASAGTYILYASHIAAMAPATNLGAATPVAIGGPTGSPEPGPERPPDAPTAGKDADKKDSRSPVNTERRAAPSSRDSLREKAVNDAAAYIRSLAQLRGRNAEFAEQAVLRATSMSADEAVRGGPYPALTPTPAPAA